MMYFYSSQTIINLKMRLFLSIALFSLTHLNLSGQVSSSQIDSLATTVNSSSSNMKRLMNLEKSLSAIVKGDPDQLQDFLDHIDYSTLNTHNLLLIDAFDARKLMYEGKPEEIIDLPSKGNPFIKFYQGNAYFNQGNNQKAIDLNIEASKLFSYYNDTVYIASCYNNIGAVHWHLNNLDSALYYFQSAKSYTYWHNEMLENNILAISNVLQNEELSRQQIATIRAKSDGTPSPYFLNNAYFFFDKYEPLKADSLRIFIQRTYPRMTEVPMPLLPIFIENKWKTDSLKYRLGVAQGNSFFDNALRKLLTSELIGDSLYSDSTLFYFARKTNSSEDSVLATIMAPLSAKERIALARSVEQMVEDQNIENSEKLSYAAKEFTEKIEEQEFTIRKFTLGIMALFSLGLLSIIIQQRRKIHQSKERLKLANKNMELAKENDFIQSEIKKARKGIEDIAGSSMRQVKKLRQAVDEIGNNPSHATELMSDLNIITTHEEGMLRFKIKKVAEGLSSPSFEKVEQHLNAKESQILKLTLLEFRSKEIAALLGVSPQHINNLRSKIKAKVEEEMNENYDELVDSLSREFFLN